MYLTESCKRCSILLVLLSVNFGIGESQSLSIGGCACTSRCDKSWSSNGPWCYVDAKCQSAGWDSCQDVQSLYASAIKEKAHEEQELQDAVKDGAALEKRLDATKMRLKDAESTVASLKLKLADAAAKETLAHKRAVADAARIIDFEHKVVNGTGMMKMKASIVQAEDAQHQAEAKAQKVQKKLSEVEDMEQQHSVTIKVMQNKIMKAEDAAEKYKESELKHVQQEAALWKASQMAEETLQDTEEKLAQASKKQSEAETKLEHAELKHKDEQSAMEKKVQDGVEKLNDSEDAMIYLKAASKKAQAEADKRFEKMELVAQVAEKKLKDAETKHADMQQKVKDAEKKHAEAQEQLVKAVKETHAARLDAKIYKIFKDANSKTPPSLRAAKAH